MHAVRATLFTFWCLLFIIKKSPDRFVPPIREMPPRLLT